MGWDVKYTEDAKQDLCGFDKSVQKRIVAVIKKVSKNPLPQNEGGYGKPLGNKHGIDLSNLLKIKIKKPGIRIIYTIVREAETMEVIIIGIRSDETVYKEAKKRINKQ